MSRPAAGSGAGRRRRGAADAGAGRTPRGPRRRLLLLRHAKAERDPERDDHERPLARRGHEDAARIGEALAELGPAPERVLCSSSRRTRETLQEILPHLPRALDVVIDRELYLADPERMLARIAAVDDGVRTLLVVGHNPGIAELAELLAGEGDAGSLARLREKFPTGALAELRAPAPRWRDLAPRGSMLTAFLTPRGLAGRDG